MRDRFLIDLRKTILLVFALAGFSHSQGQKPKLHRNMADRFTSISGHIGRYVRI
jgi:hypothetical protein